MNTIDIGEHTYRIKKMNAIELLALSTQVSFDTLDKTLDGYAAFLERLEVLVRDDDWVEVKEKGKEKYHPVGIENDFSAVQSLLNFFMGYLQEVFIKSGKSKSEQA